MGSLEEGHRAAYAVRVSANPAHQPRDEAERWVLPTDEGIVTQLQFGRTIEQWLHIRIDAPFVVQAGEETIECHPETAESIAPLVGLLRPWSARQRLTKTGR